VKADPTFWILARATGLTAYVLLTATVLGGLVLKSRPFGARVRAATALDVHRFVTVLALGAVALHAAALVLDTTVHISLLALVVPGVSPYRPLAVGLGVVACELAALLAVSFSVRRRIGFRIWRRLHWSAYLVFVLATAHGIAAGTDSARPWAIGVYLGAVGAVAFATAWRTLARPTRPIPVPARERSA